MDSQYKDLFIKYTNVPEEVLWSRAMIMADLQFTLQLIDKMNAFYQEANGKSLIEYIRIE